MTAIREKWFDLAILALYAVILTALLSNHVFWRDEMQAWLIARDSASLADLFRNLRHEGHPGLWHLLLMPATRLTHDPEIMLWLQAVLAIGTMSVIVLASPLSRLEKAIVPFTYFPLIEYGIVSRSYILGFLLVSLVCVVWPRRFERPVILAALLALLANVHIFFTIMTIAFALAYASTRRAAEARAPRGREIFAAALLCAGLVIAVVTATPASETGAQWFTAFDQDRAVTILKSLGALFGREKLRYGILAVAAIVFLIWHQRRERSASVFLAAATFGLAAFMYMRYPGWIYNHGVYFITFLAAVWIGRTAAVASTQFLMVAVLIVAVSMTPRSVRREFSTPRSHAYDVARFIEQSGWKDQPLISFYDFPGSTVVGYLGIDRAYYPEGGRWGSFVIWDDARKNIVDLETALQATGVPATLILTPNADVEGLEEAGFRRVVGFTEPWTHSGESYVLYRHDSR